MSLALPLRARLGGYAEYEPPDDLRSVVDSVWTYVRPADAPPIPGEGHRVVPEASLSLVFASRRGRHGRIFDCWLSLIGPTTAPRFFAPAAGLHAGGIRIHPEWARDILGVDPADHSNTSVPAGEVCRRQLPHAYDRLARTESLGAVAGVFFDELRRRVASARISRESRLAHAARSWLASHSRPTLALDSLSRRLGVSERHLRRAVKTVTGASPKYLHRIARFAGAMLAADRLLRPDWSRLAVDHGFYDQAHMIQEFRAMSGCSPVQLHMERRLQR